MQVQEVANPVPVNSAVSAVTVYADRTRVTRKTSVELKAGTQILEFSRLPGWIDENSVRIAVQPSDAALTPDIS
jgi:hypothetical protein